MLLLGCIGRGRGGVVDDDERSGALRHEERAVGVGSEMGALQEQAAFLQHARAHLVVLDLAARGAGGRRRQDTGGGSNQPCHSQLINGMPSGLEGGRNDIGAEVIMKRSDGKPRAEVHRKSQRFLGLIRECDRHAASALSCPAAGAMLCAPARDDCARFRAEANPSDAVVS